MIEMHLLTFRNSKETQYYLLTPEQFWTVSPDGYDYWMALDAAFPFHHAKELKCFFSAKPLLDYVVKKRIKIIDEHEGDIY